MVLKLFAHSHDNNHFKIENSFINSGIFRRVILGTKWPFYTEIFFGFGFGEYCDKNYLMLLKFQGPPACWRGIHKTNKPPKSTFHICFSIKPNTPDD